MAQPARVTFIVVSYRTRDLLAGCLASIKAYGGDGPTLVVDNASGDGTAQMVARDFPAVRLIAAEENLGFGRACNLGARTALTPFLFFLNPDARLHADTVPHLLTYIENHKKVAVVGPLLRDAAGGLEPSMRDEPTPGRLLRENLPIWKNFAAKHRRHDRPRRCDWLVGAALLVRRDAFASVNGFDESIHLYYEDADLCLRLRDAGWETHFTPDAAVTHVGGASSRAAFGSAEEVLCRYAAARARFVLRRYGRRAYGRYRAAYGVLLALRRLKARWRGDAAAARLARRQWEILRGITGEGS